MSDTKEKILTASLELFAKDGYEAVSVSTIADRLGITKGALYKHYKNKRDIFDSIVNRMYEIDAERSRMHKMPEAKYEDGAEPYGTVTAADVEEFTLAQFDFWTKDAFAGSFRRMLLLEQYRNGEMASLYENCVSRGPMEYTRDIFREMIGRGELKNADPDSLALEYYSPFYLLISLWDSADGARRKAYEKLLKNHIKDFFSRNRQ